MGGNRRSHFVILVVWSAQIVSEWVVVAWGRKSYLGPAEIFTFCVPGSIQGWGTQGESKTPSSLHFFDVDPRNKGFMYKRLGAKNFLRGSRNRKILLRPTASC